ncbi:hypothetical protein [Undibacterium sp. TJN19]|uniref:phage tail tube protein n=1 Tax=Undibacterium sp. TJN19 TaxID=3413055 RepID=UPI003BF2C1FC
MPTTYLLGQGKVYIAKRDAFGNPKALRWLGDVSAAKLALKVTNAEQKESYSGQRGTVKRVQVGKEATIELTMMEINTDNLALNVSGVVTNTPSGSVTGEALPVVVAGNRVAFKNPGVTSVVITDSASTPVTLATTKYKVDPAFGAVDFKDVTGATQPFLAAYSHGAVDSVAMFNAQQEDDFLRYEGINLAENGAPIIVELYKVNSEPLKELALITDKFAEMQITAAVLIDGAKTPSDELGQFGRILQIAAS